MVHFRVIVESFISYPESEEFAKWAWGEKYKELVREQLPDQWNHIHGDELILHSAGRICEDIPLMIELWRKHNETK